MTSATISIYDDLGDRIETVEDNQYQSGDNYMRIDISNLSQGVYFLRVEQDGLTLEKRFVVER